MSAPVKIVCRLHELGQQIDEDRAAIAQLETEIEERCERINLHSNSLATIERTRSTLQWAVAIYEEEWQEGGIVDLDEPVVAVVGTPHAPDIRGGAAPERDAHQPPAPVGEAIPVETGETPLKERIFAAMSDLEPPILASRIAEHMHEPDTRRIAPMLGRLHSEKRIRPAISGGGWELSAAREEEEVSA